MDDARQVENLLYRYAEAVDAGDFDAVAELFAEATIVPYPDAPSDHHVVGRDAVRAMYERTTRRYDDGTPRTRHVTTNVIVDVVGDAASARSSYLVLQQTDDLSLQPIIVGRYHDDFERTAGEWRFARRTMFVDLVGELVANVSYHNAKNYFSF